MKLKLKDILKEENIEEQEFTLTEEDKKEFFENIKNFSSLRNQILGSDSNLRKIAETLAKYAKIAEHITLNETDDWFDKITINKNMKQLKNISNDFTKAASDMQSIKERVSSLFDDMGHVLNKYFDVN